MEKFTTLTGVAAPLPMVNIDTDMIIPAKFLKSIKRDGFGPSLFYPLRYDEKGNERPDFILNQPAYRKAKILIAGRNFGCGSSREHAPWALDNFGIRCVIAPDFADIFFNNASKNGMLLIKLPQAVCDELTKDAENGANATFTIDLEKQEIVRPDGQIVKFEIDAHKKYCLLNGLDDIGLTLKKNDKIAAYEAKQKTVQPWV
jgi:3-isopropylmalate/(R)-2-methylmalate dehydratase small subunit